MWKRKIKLLFKNDQIPLCWETSWPLWSFISQATIAQHVCLPGVGCLSLTMEQRSLLFPLMFYLQHPTRLPSNTAEEKEWLQPVFTATAEIWR